MTDKIISEDRGHISIRLFKEKYQSYCDDGETWHGWCEICGKEKNKCIRYCSGNKYYSIFVCKECLSKGLEIVNE